MWDIKESKWWIPLALSPHPPNVICYGKNSHKSFSLKCSGAQLSKYRQVHSILAACPIKRWQEVFLCIRPFLKRHKPLTQNSLANRPQAEVRGTGQNKRRISLCYHIGNNSTVKSLRQEGLQTTSGTLLDRSPSYSSFMPVSCAKLSGTGWS